MGHYRKSRIHTEKQLSSQTLGFSAAFLAIQYLTSHIQSHPEDITEETLEALLATTETPGFEKRKQALFLYRSAFEALVEMAVAAPCPVPSRTIIGKLQDKVFSSSGHKTRAASQALGLLPIEFTPTRPDKGNQARLPIDLDTLLQAAGAPMTKMDWKGRSLVVSLETGEKLTLKFATRRADIPDLLEELFWMESLDHTPPCRQVRFCLPRPIRIRSHALFTLPGLPLKQGIDRDAPAVAFVCPRDYYAYPNQETPATKGEEVLEIFRRNARLLGALTGKGIIHTALIPLFHNRVQQHRREDQGRYEWELGGRLDQWLDSCRYPNFAGSGLRDFEHMVCLENQKGLHHYIGEHLLSFILVMGSYFRARNPRLKGKDAQGRPADARVLFDETLFTAMIHQVVRSYCRGMNQQVPRAVDALPYQELTRALILRMGRDEHMEETLRVRDQQEMSQAEFHAFLKERGVSCPETYEKDREDILLSTGPHLGGFNQPISVPELIDFLFCVSALCLSDRYLKEVAPPAIVPQDGPRDG